MHWILWLLGAGIVAFMAFFSPNAVIAGWMLNATHNVSSVSNCSNIFTKSGNAIAVTLGDGICSGEHVFSKTISGFGLDPFHVLFVVAAALVIWFLIDKFILHSGSDWILKLVVIVILLVLLGIL